MKRTLTTTQLLAELPTSVSKDSIRRWAREGRLPFDVTPGGHRRFCLEEALVVLDPAPKTHLTPIVVGRGKTHIGSGPSLTASPAETLSRRARAVETTPVEQMAERAAKEKVRKRTATSELFGSARRVLVGTGA